jgi:sulfur transfer complex TusBCD TusB component (DsrH family)
MIVGATYDGVIDASEDEDAIELAKDCVAASTLDSPALVELRNQDDVIIWQQTVVAALSIEG